LHSDTPVKPLTYFLTYFVYVADAGTTAAATAAPTTATPVTSAPSGTSSKYHFQHYIIFNITDINNIVCILAGTLKPV